MNNLSEHWMPQTEQDMLLTMVAETLELEPAELAVDTDLLATGRMDSLAIVNLVSFIEERMGVVLSIDQIVPENFRSVRHLQTLVEKAQQNQ